MFIPREVYVNATIQESELMKSLNLGQQMTRTDQATILTQHLATDIFISNSFEIIEFAFKTFVISSSPPKNLIGQDSKHWDDVNCEKHRFPNRMYVIWFCPVPAPWIYHTSHASATYASAIQYSYIFGTNPKWTSTFHSAMPLSYIEWHYPDVLNVKGELVTLALNLRPALWDFVDFYKLVI